VAEPPLSDKHTLQSPSMVPSLPVSKVQTGLLQVELPAAGLGEGLQRCT
jgi:hypothetical protein